MEKHKKALDLLFLEVTGGDLNKNCSEHSKSFPIDVYNDDEKYVITAELPGLKYKEINIQYQDNYLEIEARKKQDENGLVLLRRERCYGVFRRSFFIEGIDEDSITANFRDGILIIEIKKARIK